MRPGLGPCLGALALASLGAAEVARAPSPDSLLLETPAGERYAHIDRGGETVLPLGRLLTPAGRQIDTAPQNSTCE